MPNIQDPRPGNLQTIIISKEKAKTADEAKAIAKEVGATHLEPEETTDSWRFRQRNPSDFIDDKYGSKKLPNGATLVYGTLRSDMKHSERFKGVPFLIQLAEGDAIPEEIQLFKVGKFYDPRYGEFEITTPMLLSMVNNFKKGVRGIDLAVDFAHDTEGKSAAWFKDVYLSDDGKTLWAKVEWTPSGKDTVKSKEFRYISPDFTNDFMNNETKETFGPTLNGAGLTNRPVIKGMEPIVQLSEVPNINNNTGGNMDPKDQEIADLKKKVADLEAKLAKDPGAGNEPDDMMQMKQQLADMTKKCADYEAANKQAAEAQKLAEKKGKFDIMLKEGKVVEAQREPFMKDDMGKFTELAQPLKLSEIGSGGTGDGNKGKSVIEQVRELAAVKLSEKKAHDLGAAYTMVLSENKELAAEYYKQTTKKTE